MNEYGIEQRKVRALESIAKSLEKIANPPVATGLKLPKTYQELSAKEQQAIRDRFSDWTQKNRSDWATLSRYLRSANLPVDDQWNVCHQVMEDRIKVEDL